MHATAILRRCLPSVLGTMHAARERRLLQAVEALVQGRRLTLTDLARSWPGATWMHAPLKALDRLLSNHHLQQAVAPLQRAMAAWLIRQPQPLLLVDWADLKEDGRWCVLRAAVPVGGRALTLFEQVFPSTSLGSPKAQGEFLRALQQWLPPGVTPVVVSDAGFRSDWWRGVRKLGWHFIGRVRNNTGVCAADMQWKVCTSLHAKATSTPRDLGIHRIVKGDPMNGRLVLVRRQRCGREQYTRDGTPRKGTQANKSRKAAREPWLLVTSLGAETQTAAFIVAAYAKRMQIEEAFRDLKSHRYGMGLEDSLTRSASRLSILLLLHALTTFAAWLMGLAVDADTIAAPDPLARQPRHRARYSRVRRGLAWLRHVAIPPEIRSRITAACLRKHVAAVA